MPNFGPTDGPTTRRRSRHLEGVKEIDPRDYDLLRRFLTDHGRIVPSRFTGATPKQQREIAKAIRRARVMGLLR
jgi:small subunit ribosomal protein S18